MGRQRQERDALAEPFIIAAESYTHGNDADQALAAHLCALAEPLRG
jgi:hypothetical protein